VERKIYSTASKILALAEWFGVIGSDSKQLTSINDAATPLLESLTTAICGVFRPLLALTRTYLQIV